eukprot:3650918-Amphidinium_carterae.1
MEQAGVLTGNMHPIGVLTQDLADFSRSLYFLLAQLLAGKALTILRAVPDQHGFAAWRTLKQHYEPSIATRTVGLLQHILNPTMRQSSLAEWEEDLLTWEADVRRYERETSKQLDVDIQVAVAMSRLPSSMAGHIQARAKDFHQDYPALRGAVTSFLEANR